MLTINQEINLCPLHSSPEDSPKIWNNTKNTARYYYHVSHGRSDPNHRRDNKSAAMCHVFNRSPVPVVPVVVLPTIVQVSFNLTSSTVTML